MARMLARVCARCDVDRRAPRHRYRHPPGDRMIIIIPSLMFSFAPRPMCRTYVRCSVPGLDAHPLLMASPESSHNPEERNVADVAHNVHSAQPRPPGNRRTVRPTYSVLPAQKRRATHSTARMRGSSSVEESGAYLAYNARLSKAEDHPVTGEVARPWRCSGALDNRVGPPRLRSSAIGT